MRPTPESEARLRAALTWSARQMPAAPPSVRFETPVRRRPRRGVAAAIAVAAAFGAALLWMPRSGGIETVSTEVADTAAPATSAPATSAPATGVPATTIAATTTYVLQPYDWIGSVAQKFGITMEQLAELNGWPDGLRHVFLTGDTILVPAVSGTTETG